MSTDTLLIFFYSVKWLFIKNAQIAQCGEFSKNAFGGRFCKNLLALLSLKPLMGEQSTTKTNENFEVVEDLIFSDIFYEQNLTQI